ncbi:TetR family transcriptional regulator [Prauserella marina]|uniref:DNA-binding transcriptional regulator, AcrR family n=1 Tax=Prauserella marina TaxID=530584 RepID=A0A222VR66_9PSEU|nr:TetR/AcrR family transcriptional regulator [Prauserella marina]ASR36233.1 TetR family transcriptional regulator [Prauserella marina]PWV76998.1 TetR family transcriptional regulator [Prauserella marina]SDD02052.1 DNA-binding transcriptional regulator, AcrR family [Prauserella marina]
MTTQRAGLREQKKQATRKALREAALRLALEHGAENVRVDDIAEAAGVSPRTYNNYFSSREQAIVAAVTAQREAGVAAAVVARPAGVGLAEAVVEAIAEQYTDPGERQRDALLLITTHPPLRDAFVDTAGALENSLAEAITQRLGNADPDAARVLAASVAAATRVALQRWIQPATASPATAGFVVPSGSLPDLLRAALAPLAPALDAAGKPPVGVSPAAEPGPR